MAQNFFALESSGFSQLRSREDAALSVNGKPILATVQRLRVNKTDDAKRPPAWVEYVKRQENFELQLEFADGTALEPEWTENPDEALLLPWDEAEQLATKVKACARVHSFEKQDEQKPVSQTRVHASSDAEEARRQRYQAMLEREHLD